jgi:hypothetical protein
MLWSSSPTAVKSPAADQGLQQLVLHGVGVLHLVDQHVAQAPLPLGADLGVARSSCQRQADQVVEVHRLEGAQALLEACITCAATRSSSSFATAAAPAASRPWFFHRLMVHCQRRASALSVLPPAVAQHAEHVVAVEDREVGLQAQARPSSRSKRTPSAWKVLTSSSLAARGPVSALARSRISCAALLVKVMAAISRRRQPALQQAHDLVRDHARLAGAGAGQHQAGAAQVLHGLHLGVVEGVCHRGRRS